MSFFRYRCGFTMIELLMVIVILGVMVAMIGPAFTAGSDIARVRTAARGVMQMSRYARTMALLHQTPLDLVFTSDGHLSVAEVGGGGGGLVSAAAFGVTNASALVAAKEAGEPASVSDDAAAESGGASYVMADLAIGKQYERAAFVFDGYTDSLEEKAGGETVSEEETEDAGQEKPVVRTFRVRYKSNGTCRPYRVKVAVASETGVDDAQALTVTVDVLGAARIEEDEEP